MSDAPTRSVAPAGDATADRPASNATRDFPAQTGDLSGPVVALTAPSLPEAPPGYELLEEVGSGGMGIIYRARELAFDRVVAVKLLRDRYAVNSPAAQRFLNEARITAQLQHPAIPPVHHIGTLPNGRPFLAMKLIKGETLADLLTEAWSGHSVTGSAEPGHGVTGPQPTADRGRFITVFEQVCQAMAYAHSRKVIHRDLKPANVMVGAFGEVQVMDWGLAKVLGSPERAEPTGVEVEHSSEIRTHWGVEAITQAGSVLGTPSYMAPEQAQGAVNEIDERSDVFGLGAMLCAILTGKPPYTAEDSDSVRLMAIRGETEEAFERLDACCADLELVALCKRCLVRERNQRLRHAGEVARAVTAYLDAVEDRPLQTELDRVRAECELAEAKLQTTEAELQATKQRKRCHLQFALVGVALLLFTTVERHLALQKQHKYYMSAAVGAHKNVDAPQAQAAEAPRGKQVAVAPQAQAAEAPREEQVARNPWVPPGKQTSPEVSGYGRAVQAAYQELQKNNFVGARALLAGTKPELRGWEWHYIHGPGSYSLFTLRGSTGVVKSVSLSPDGSRIVTGSSDRTVKLWDAKTGIEVYTLYPYTSDVYDAWFSPNGTEIVTYGREKTNITWVKVWDVKTGAERPTSGPEGIGSAASIRSAVLWTVTNRWGNTAEVQSGTGSVLTLVHASKVTSAAFSPGGSRIVTCSDDRTMKLWDAKTGVEVFTLEGHADHLTAVSFSPDGSRILAVSEDGTVKIWDSRSVNRDLLPREVAPPPREVNRP